MGFVFFPFCNFLYCVLSFCYPFIFFPGEGGVGFSFNFLIIIFYMINKKFGILFTF